MLLAAYRLLGIYDRCIRSIKSYRKEDFCVVLGSQRIMFDKYSFIDASDLESVFQQFLNECRGNDQYIHEMREYAVLVLDSVSRFFNSKEDYSLYPNWRFDRILFMLLFIAGILQISDGFTKTPRIKKQIYAIFEICSSVFCETQKKNTRRDKRIYYKMDKIISLLENHVRSEQMFDTAEKKMLVGDYAEALLFLCDACSDTGRSKNDEDLSDLFKIA